MRELVKILALGAAKGAGVALALLAALAVLFSWWLAA